MRRARELVADFLRKDKPLRFVTRVIDRRIENRYEQAGPEAVAELIRCVFPAHGQDGEAGVRVGGCESGLRWDAVNGSYKGIFQHGEQYWPSRAATYGHEGASIFDVYAQTNVTAQYVRDHGWDAWSCQP